MHKNYINDQINFADAFEVSELAFAILNAIQTITQKGILYPALLEVVLMMSEKYGMDQRDLAEALSKTERMLKDTLDMGKGEHTRAIKMFMNKEL